MRVEPCVDGTLRISNLSAHDIEVVAIGSIHSDGTMSSWFEPVITGSPLPMRIMSRSEVNLLLPESLVDYTLHKVRHGERSGCFIRIAGGTVHGNRGPLRRAWWRLRSWLEPKEPMQL